MYDRITKKKIRRKNRLDQAASDKASMMTQMKQMLQHLQMFTAAMAEFAKGDNWAARTSDKGTVTYVWIEGGNPQGLADAVMTKVFGRNWKEQMKSQENVSKIKVVSK